MASEEIYSPLLEEQRREVISGTDDVSWYAYRRAENLVSDADKEELLALLKRYAESPKRSHIYLSQYNTKGAVPFQTAPFVFEQIELIAKGAGTFLLVHQCYLKFNTHIPEIGGRHSCRK